jgi:hypothetical protein
MRNTTSKSIAVGRGRREKEQVGAQQKKEKGGIVQVGAKW